MIIEKRVRINNQNVNEHICKKGINIYISDNDEDAYVAINGEIVAHLESDDGCINFEKV